VVFQECFTYSLARRDLKNFPPILHKKKFITIYNCSKGARGLSV